MQSPPAAFAHLRRQLRATGQRRLLVISGTPDNARRRARELFAGARDVLWFASGEGAAKAARHRLGGECADLVFDAFAGLEPDALGALAGTVRAGGVLCLLCPPPEQWPAWPDAVRDRLAPAGRPLPAESAFLRHLVRVLRADPDVLFWNGEADFPEVRLPAPPACRPPPADPETGALTADQQAAVQAVLRTGRGRARRPVVLTADRGRGKSAALGLAAARLLHEGHAHIVVTAPRPAACEEVFRQAQARLPEADRQGNRLVSGSGELRFVAPDALLHETDADSVRLLLVDEAAGIPPALLRRMLQRFPRIAFATTVHGYEGTGRGFAVRFRDDLERLTPDWRGVELEQPIRWAAGDPLERVIGRALLFDAEPAAPQPLAGVTPDAVTHAMHAPEELVAEPALLQQLFGLLVQAHYRTRPFDLRLILDAPNLETWTLRYRGRVVAAALVAEEGGLDDALAGEIAAGRRRPPGHLLPETLAAQEGLAAAPLLHAWRVVRIAVHPAARGRGLGRHLLAVLARAAAGRADYLGSSFGATAQLLRFWRGAGWLPVRMGQTRGTSTGEHAATVLYPLSPAGGELVEAARQRFADLLVHWLPDVLGDLETAPVLELLAGLEVPGSAPGEDDLAALAAAARGERALENVLPAVWRCLLRRADALARLPENEAGVLVRRVLQHRSWRQICRELQLPGRARAQELARQGLRAVLGEGSGS